MTDFSHVTYMYLFNITTQKDLVHFKSPNFFKLYYYLLHSHTKYMLITVNEILTVNKEREIILCNDDFSLSTYTQN